MVTQTPDGKILFQFYRPDVRQMSIAGDFNGWQRSFQMTRGRDGWWRSHVELAPGTYRFRYLADGQWYTDYAAFGLEPGPFGWNSVLKVDPPEQQRAATAGDQRKIVREPIAAPLVAEMPSEPSPAPERHPQRVRRRPVLVG